MKHCLILGAHSDVALAIAHQLAKEGHSLWLAARRFQDLEPIQKDLEIRYGVPVACFAFDAEKPESHQAFVEALPECPDEVYLVFGYLGPHPGSLEHPTDARRIVQVNFAGAVSVLQALALAMQKRGKGAIAGISSVAGERGRKSNFLYGSAKAGLSAYLDGLRNYGYHHGFHVCTVKPGFIQTAMTAGMDLPKPLTASPEQVAKATISGLRKKKGRVYVLPIWQWIMCLIRNIPDSMFRKKQL